MANKSMTKNRKNRYSALMLNLVYKCLLLVSVCCGSANILAAQGTTNQLLIEYRGTALQVSQSVQSASVFSTGESSGQRRSLGGNRYVIQLPREMTLAEAELFAQDMLQDSQVISAIPNKRFQAAFIPNDPDFFAQWNLIDGADDLDPDNLPVQTWGINAKEAWDITTGSGDIVVAVLDSGILPHADINPNRILPGYDFISDPEIENDSQPGRDSDPVDPGTAVFAGECGVGEPSQRDSWHGLLVTSMIIAEANNHNFITGIDHQAKVLPVRVLGKCGGLVSDINDAIRWAAGLSIPGVPANPTPANVINLSFSGLGACSRPEQAAINDAVLAGAVVVTAAGNSGDNSNLYSPANCNNIIAVGASRRDGGVTTYTNIGTVTDISAPGGDSDSTTMELPDGQGGVETVTNRTGRLIGLTNNNSFERIEGTSFSSAQVSAAASLLLAVKPSLKPWEIEAVLQITSRPFPANVVTLCPDRLDACYSACTVQTCGSGILNIKNAVEFVAAEDAVIPSVQPIFDLGNGGGGGGCVLRYQQESGVIGLSGLLLPLLFLMRRGTANKLKAS
ncbi:MAG: S8 family peptidase [Gammaproteobacteria bacterium]